MRKQLCALTALVLLLSWQVATTPSSPLAAVQSTVASPISSELRQALANIEKLADEEFSKDPIGSVTIGVVAGPELVWTKSYGYADMEGKRPATKDSVYRIGSITKQFTALMLLQLAEQKKVRLSDPVEMYYPEYAKIPKLYPEMRSVTLLQVATMMSGLSREPEGPPDHSRGPVSGWEEKVRTSLPLTKYAHEPGTQFLYSNIGYAMLGGALSRAANQPFVEYVQQHILTPLKMTQTSFEPTDALKPLLARGYSVRDGKADASAADREQAGRGYRVPNGALLSTVGDLARFLAFELGEGPSGVLKKETQDSNFSRVYSANGALTTGYGLGFQLIREGDLVAYGHGGSTAGFRAQALFNRPSKTGIIVLRSADGGSLNPGMLAMRSLSLAAASVPSTRRPSTGGL